MRRTRVISVFRLLSGTLLVAACGAMAQPGAGELKLPVPQTFDLTHVEAKHYAVALGKDPARIFNFVKDQIAHEVYAGCLRGPRGTLMAMAGNSVDRAALLASLLRESGHQVRFVRGTLPKAEAKKLVDSMWVERTLPAPAKAEGEPSPALKVALDTLVAGVTRDYTLIRDHLKRAKITPSPQSTPSLDSLVQEAQEHFWVQWSKDSTWVDLDPSFADATPGRKYATVAETFDALPEKLFHQVSIRIRLEEYGILLTGDAEGKPASRTILTHTTKAADLSGKDVVLTHQPENWQGPAASLQAALSSAITSTGRVKPVLLLGDEKLAAGEAFRQKPPTGRGIGGISGMLGGTGTRNPVPIATAETVEFEFIYPGGRKETVVREIFDVVGKARRGRATGPNLNADEVRKRTEAETALNVTEAVYDLFFTTGRVDGVHLRDLGDDPREPEGEGDEVRAGLQRINIAFAVTSDMLIWRSGQPNRAIVVYPDSPRLTITELSTVGGAPRISLDLRRYYGRTVAIAPHAEGAFSARVFRGVVDGTLERILVEYVTADTREKERWGPVISTSLVFERAQAEGVPMVLLSQGGAGLGEGVPGDTRARVREELADRYLALAPERAIHLGKGERFGWWRIDPRSGETIAVTDEGLHQGAYEYNLIQGRGRVYVIVRYEKQVIFRSAFRNHRNLMQYLRALERDGVRRFGPLTRLPGFP